MPGIQKKFIKIIFDFKNVKKLFKSTPNIQSM